MRDKLGIVEMERVGSMAVEYVNKSRRFMKDHGLREPELPESFADLDIVLEKADRLLMMIEPHTKTLRIYWNEKRENVKLCTMLLSHESEHFAIAKTIDSDTSLLYDLGGTGDKVNEILGRKGTRSGDIGDLTERMMNTELYRRNTSPAERAELAKLLRNWKKSRSNTRSVRVR